ncbi:DM13 domain-containing protein [Paractinoplanes rishiriensis]|uniref:DM13 domain-containing protein n=1 Tax=Paractinoplanes rishiriensis TaxID=1050105 RepID=UPI001940A151
MARAGPAQRQPGRSDVRHPAGTDLDRLTSVSIWCKRFAVSFGAAGLGPVA